MGDGRPQRSGIGGGGVGLDVGAGEGVGVAGAVDGGDVDALGLEGLGDAGGAGEEIECGAGAGGLADAGEDGDETALGADVLDHRGRVGLSGLSGLTAGPPYDGRSWCLGTIQRRPGWVLMRPPSRTGCGGTRHTRIRRRPCRCACGRCSPCWVPLSTRSRRGSGHCHGYPSRADPDREPVCGPGARRHRRRGDPSTGTGRCRHCWSSSIRPSSPSLGTGPTGPAWRDRIRIVEGDASLARLYAEEVPADIVLVCGVFGNISTADITHTIQAMRGFCAPGAM